MRTNLLVFNIFEGVVCSSSLCIRELVVFLCLLGPLHHIYAKNTGHSTLRGERGLPDSAKLKEAE